MSPSDAEQRRRRRAATSARGALLLCVALGACGSSPTAAPSATPSANPAAWRQHTDAAAGFVIQYPDAWNVYAPTSAGVQFLAGPDGSDFVEVRVIPNLPVDLSSADSNATKAVIDNLLAGQTINIISTTQVTFAGLRGWQYTYSFSDPNQGTGVHIHVFLFQGTRLHTLVFQALPSTKLKALAPSFDQILTRYRPLPLASASPGTSTPAATATPSASP